MPARRSRVRRLCFALLQGGAALVLALLLAEVAVRVLGLRPPERMTSQEQGLLQPVPEATLPGVGHVLRPSARSVARYPGTQPEQNREVVYATNDLGWREEPFRADKPEGVYRIVLVGDSITYGTGIALEETLAHQLRPLLAERFPGAAIEVLNCGIPATNTRQQVALLGARTLKLDPDLVVIVSTIVDASGYGIPGPVDHERPAASEWVERLGLTSGRYDAEDLPPTIAATMAWRRRSALVDLAAHHLYRQLYSATLVANYRATWAEGSPGLAAVESALNRAVALCRKHGCRLHVAMFPFLAGLDGDYPFAQEVARLEQVCARLEVPFTHLLPALEGHRPLELMAHAHDRHPNGKANALAAHHLARALLPDLAADLESDVATRGEDR